jgi:ABC-2 type transport system ATP-binding protein
MRLHEGNGSAVKSRVDQITGVERSVIVSESPLTVRAYPRRNSASDELSRALGDLAIRERWQLEELHTEEGRLDEVFRNITLSDTATEPEQTK